MKGVGLAKEVTTMNTTRTGIRDSINRRRFLSTATALGLASLFEVSRAVAAEKLPETRKIRFYHAPAICLAPQYLAGEMLRLEGFDEVEYVKLETMPGPAAVASGRADFTMWDIPSLVPVLDAGEARAQCTRYRYSTCTWPRH